MDTKLDRDVAKVLPEVFTSDPDRLARFEREAKVLASLNHANIGHIYGLEEAEGTKGALVLELVERPGRTLASPRRWRRRRKVTQVSLYLAHDELADREFRQHPGVRTPLVEPAQAEVGGHSLGCQEFFRR